MSSIYVLEPPTKGKVVLNTTVGPLDIELWAKEAPKAVRNFVQLCLEGYYDSTFFHRIIKSFMVQGGDPTGTGKGGDTIYGAPFPDEVHSRLRFNHRGLVACANAGTKNSNNSQFFITLDRTDWLDKLHTIFGKVTGDSVFNLVRLGELETDTEDRPLQPPKITSVEVLWNPFEDIVPRQLKKPVVKEGKPVTAPKDARPKKKQLNLLSFGEEAEEEEQILSTTKGKIQSSHDVLNDPRLLKGDQDSEEMDPKETKRRKDLQSSVRQALTAAKDDVDKLSERKTGQRFRTGDEEDDSEYSFDSKMRQQVLERRQRLEESKVASTTKTVRDAVKDNDLRSKKPPVPARRRDEDDSDDGDKRGKASKKDKLVIKDKGLGSEAKADHLSKADVDSQLLTPLQQQLQSYKQRKRRLQGREEATLAKLDKFKSKLLHTVVGREAPVEDKQAADVPGDNWLSHQLKFEVDPTKKDTMARNDDPNQYVLHDPLVEKGKEKFNRVQAREKRRNREWAGRSLT